MERQKRSDDTSSTFVRIPEYHYRVSVRDAFRSWDEGMKRRLYKSKTTDVHSEDLQFGRDSAFEFVDKLKKDNPSLSYQIYLIINKLDEESMEVFVAENEVDDEVDSYFDDDHSWDY